MLFPETYSGAWYELPATPKRKFDSFFAIEFVKFVVACKFASLIFLSEKSSLWLTKLSASRTDYQPLMKAVTYFKFHKLDKKFKGGVEVPISELAKFIQHYYCITRCDASFHPGYFLNTAQSFIGFIHYSGEIQVLSLNKKFDGLFEKVLPQTKYRRSDRK